MEPEKIKLFNAVDDYRAFFDKYPDPRQWRIYLRKKLFKDRFGRSDLTQRALIGGFDLHEGIFERRWVAKRNWQHILFSGVNCFLLPDDEHRVLVPDRTTCYWLAVSRYGRDNVDAWIESLDFKTVPSKPWIGTCGSDIVQAIKDKYKVSSDWDKWFAQIEHKVGFVA